MDKNVLQVAIEDIVQPIDTSINSEHLSELTSSIKTHGIREPLILRRVDNRRYEILSGDSKYKAAKICGLASVPAFITDTRFRRDVQPVTPRSSFNYSRRTLDEARKYRDMLYINHTSTRDIAVEFGKSEYAVKSRIDMLILLSPKVQKALDSNLITERHARLLLKINSHERQDQILDMILKGRITVMGLKNIIDHENPMYLMANSEELTPITPMVGTRSKFINMNLLAQNQPQESHNFYQVIDKIKEELGPDGDVTIAEEDSDGVYEVKIRYQRVLH